MIENVTVMAGAEPLSREQGSAMGVLLVHGFTGNPSSMRGVAEAMIDAGFDIELPRLPGHGTSVDDLVTTDWAAWAAEVQRARLELEQRVERVVLAGQSMGATLALSNVLASPGVAGLICINPATKNRDDATMEMLQEYIDDGFAAIPGDGSDIADPESFDIAYDDTPLIPLQSMLVDGVAPIVDRYGELQMPLKLFTSRQDHVIDPGDSEHLAETFGGEVDHTWLERSYHVATLDYERDLVIEQSVAFVEGLNS